MAMRGDRIQVILDGVTCQATVLRITKRGNYEILVEGEKNLRIVEKEVASPETPEPAAAAPTEQRATASARSGSKGSWPMVRGKRHIASGDWVRVCETGERFQVAQVKGTGASTEVKMTGRPALWQKGQRLEKVTSPKLSGAGLLARNLLVLDWPSFFSHSLPKEVGEGEGDYDLDLAWANCSMPTERVKPILGPKALKRALERVFFLPDGVPTFVADSKTDAYFLAHVQKTERLYVLAEGADTGEGRGLTWQNWLGRLLSDADHLRQAVVIQPDAHFGFAPKGALPDERLTLTRATQLPYAPQRVPISAVLLCRSGAAAPPWLDQAFWRLAQAFHSSPKDLGLRPRARHKKETAGGEEMA